MTTIPTGAPLNILEIDPATKALSDELSARRVIDVDNVRDDRLSDDERLQRVSIGLNVLVVDQHFEIFGRLPDGTRG